MTFLQASNDNLRLKFGRSKDILLQCIEIINKDGKGIYILLITMFFAVSCDATYGMCLCAWGVG